MGQISLYRKKRWDVSDALDENRVLLDCKPFRLNGQRLLKLRLINPDCLQKAETLVLSAAVASDAVTQAKAQRHRLLLNLFFTP